MHDHTKRVVALLIATLSFFMLPTISQAEDSEPYTWHLLNTFVYQGVGWGSEVLNMEGGKANGLFGGPSSVGAVYFTAFGEVSIVSGYSRTWVASPLSPDLVQFGTSPWTLQFGGRSTIVDLEWTPGAFDPESRVFTPAQGAPAKATGLAPSTFTPSTPFTIPAGTNPALRVTAVTGASLVDTYDVLGERSPSTLSVAGGMAENEARRTQRKLQKTRCDARYVAPADECPETWVFRTGAPIGGGVDLDVSNDGQTLFETGSVNELNQDILTLALDASNGTVLWQDRYNGPGGPQDRPVKILLSPDGATLYVIGTVCVVPTAGNLNCTSEEDIVVLAYETATGVRRWVRTFGGHGSQRALTAAIAPEASALIVGATTAPVAGPADPNDVLIAALDPVTGTLSWQAIYAGSSGLWDFPSAIAFDHLGANVYVVGGTRSSATKLDALILGFAVSSGNSTLNMVLDAGCGDDDRASDIAISGNTLYVTGSGVRTCGDSSDSLTFAFDVEDKQELWRVWHDGPWGGPDAGSFLEISNGSVFVGGTEAQSSVVLKTYAAAYDAATGSRNWISRFNRPGLSYNGLRSMGLTPDGENLLLLVWSGWFGDSTRDFLTLAVDGVSGDENFRALYDGTGGGRDVPSRLAVSPDGRHVFVTGWSEGLLPSTLVIAAELTTVSYELPD